MWWDKLDEALSTDKFVDTATVHRFDVGQEFWGGLGNAGAFLSIENGTDPWLESVKDNDGKAPQVASRSFQPLTGGSLSPRMQVAQLKDRVSSDQNGVWTLKGGE